MAAPPEDIWTRGLQILENRKPANEVTVSEEQAQILLNRSKPSCPGGVCAARPGYNPNNKNEKAPDQRGSKRRKARHRRTRKHTRKTNLKSRRV
jgi:hypothetical protein